MISGREISSDETHFDPKFDNSESAKTCRIRDIGNPYAFHTSPLHSSKRYCLVCGFTFQFILRPFFFEEYDDNGPVTCSVTGS
ncbi:hypothetical protein NPIL_374061 [Nephila pilipes]|uniref:Uncharacterized protein n=1 Tax=Nephila pilipes TaxID=299642 RepID=A0A8X6P2D4_NEPPI|nr:hypothetical protein NPIL_374061 [Nephila pilipes]